MGICLSWSFQRRCRLSRSLLCSSVKLNLKPVVSFIATVQFYLCDISNSVLTLSCRWFTLQRCGAVLYWCHNTLSILSHFIDEWESRALVIYFIELFLLLGKQRNRRLSGLSRRQVTGAVLVLCRVSARKSMMNSNCRFCAWAREREREKNVVFLWPHHGLCGRPWHPRCSPARLQQRFDADSI